ncbi:winged helix-turn-helix transcriptional regulator [Hoeflea sp. CAU 1731]
MIGGKWKLSILQILIFRGTRRFGELRREIDGVAQTTLTSLLSVPEKHGLFSMKVYPEAPPRVEYSATPDAMALQPALHAMHKWRADRDESHSTRRSQR